MCLAPTPQPLGKDLFTGTPKARPEEPETPSSTLNRLNGGFFYLALDAFTGTAAGSVHVGRACPMG